MSNLVYGIQIKADGSGQVVTEVKKSEAAFAGLDAKIGNLSKSTKTASDGTKDYTAAVDSLVKRLDPAYRAAANLNEGVSLLSKGLQSGQISTVQYLQSLEALKVESSKMAESAIAASRGVKQLDDEARKLDDTLKQVSREQKQAADEARKYADAVDSLVKRLDPAYRAAANLNDGIAVLNKGLQTGQISTVQYLKSLEALKVESTKMAESANVASRGVKQLDSAVKGSNSSLNSSIGIGNSVTSSLKNMVAGYASLAAVQKVAAAIDEFKKLEAQLKNATRSQLEFNQAMANVQNIARTAQADVGAIGNTYARLSNALREVGGTQKQVAGITESLALALKVNGANGIETSAAMLQLSQSFSKGKLDGDEFRTAMELAPNAMRQLAASIGVSQGALFDLSEQGKLTTDVLIKAWNDPAFLKGLREQAEGMKTLSGAVVTTKNEFVLLLGTLDKSVGSSAGVNSLFDGINARLANIRGTIEGGNWYEKYILMLGINPALSGPALLANEGFRGRDANLKNSSSGRIISAAEQQAYKEADSLRALQASYNHLTDSVKLNSTEIKKQTDIQAEALALRQKNIISQTDYEAILKKTNNTIKSINGDKKTEKQDPLKSARENLKQLELENKLIANGATLDEAQTIAKLRLTGATDAFIAATLNANQAQKEYVENQKNAEETEKNLAKNREDAISSIDQVISKTYAESAAHKEKYDLLTLGVGVTREGELATLDQTIANIELAKSQAVSLGYTKQDIEFIGQQIDAYKRLRDAKSEAITNESNLKTAQAAKKAADEAIKENERALKESAKEAAKASEDINKSITDALMRGFENGKSFAENFRDTTKNMFKSLVLQPVVKFLVDSSGISKVFAAFSNLSASSGSSGSGSSSGQNLSGLFDSLKSSFNSANDTYKSGFSFISSGLESLGTMISNGQGGIADSIGGALGQYGSTIAEGASNYLPYVGAAIKLIQGDVKGAAFTAAGAAIGSIIPGIGTAIGAVVGSLIGSLVGKKKIPTIGSQAQGTYEDGKYTGTTSKYGKYDIGAQASLEALNKTFVGQLGGLLSQYDINSKIGVNSIYRTATNVRGFFGATVDGESFYSQVYKDKAKRADFNKFVDAVLGTELVKAIQLSKLPEGIKSLFDGLTDKTQVGQMIQASASLSAAQDQLIARFGLTADAAGKLASAQGDVLGTVNNLANAALSMRTIGQQLIDTREALLKATQFDILPTTLNGFDNILKGIDTSTEEGASKFIDVFNQRASFASLINATDGIKTNVNNALYEVVSPDRQKQMANNVLSTMFGAFNLAVPANLDALIKMGDSIDYSTQSGLDLAAAFPNLVTAFQQVQESANATTESLTQSADSFKNLVDFNQFRGVANAYGSSYAKTVLNIPSFDVGTNNVPSDMLALVHANERIIPAADNQAIINALNGNNDNLVQEELARLRADTRLGQEALIKELQALVAKLDKWDKVGLPQFDPESDKGAILDVKVAA